MNIKVPTIAAFIMLLCTEGANAQARKMDTTVKMGPVGFRVVCNNKDADENTVSIAPDGFKLATRDIMFAVKGRIFKAMADDLNEDGYPDLVMCIYNGPSAEFGTVIGVSSAENKNLAPIFFPDIFIDPKLRIGYKGHDEFYTMVGTLMRKFPIYLEGDAPGNPTGGRRTIQYKAMNDAGHLTFKVIRTFDTKPE